MSSTERLLDAAGHQRSPGDAARLPPGQAAAGAATGPPFVSQPVHASTAGML
jgi:hypothetical protein